MTVVMSDGARRAGIAGAIACTTIFALTVGLSFPLLSLVLEHQGISEAAIGINAAMTPLGIVLASPFYPRLIERFGSWQVAIGSLLLSALLILSMGLTRSFGAFLVLRLMLGMADVGIFIVSETWINQLARPETRGRVVGIYATALSVGFGAGPFTLALIGFQGFAPFAVGAVCCFLAIGVVLAAGLPAPGAHPAGGDLRLCLLGGRDAVAVSGLWSGGGFDGGGGDLGPVGGVSGQYGLAGTHRMVVGPYLAPSGDGALCTADRAGRGAVAGIARPVAAVSGRSVCLWRHGGGYLYHGDVGTG